MSTVPLPLLSTLAVASPCRARWEDMTGGEVTRHCSQCRLDVHNLSAMTAEDAEAFLRARSEGRVCVRFYRRTDGMILTADCPRGLQMLRRRAGWAVARVGAAVGVFLAAVGLAPSPGEPRLRSIQPFKTICEWLAPNARFTTPTRGFIMGKVACPSIPPGKSGPGTVNPAN